MKPSSSAAVASARCIRRYLSSSIHHGSRRSVQNSHNILQRQPEAIAPLVQVHARSMSTFAGFPIPDVLKEAVKTSILEHATSQVLKEHERTLQELQSQTSSTAIAPPLDLLYDENQDSLLQYAPNTLPPNVKSTDAFALVASELQLLVERIRADLLSSQHPVLDKAATYFFEGEQGKQLRPMMVLLMSKALADNVQATGEATEGGVNDDNLNLLLETTPPQSWQRSDLVDSQRQLAQVAELFHTASLLHDDVLDEASTRRNKEALHTVVGTKVAILAGDYLLARASRTLARMRNVTVVDRMSTVLEHLVLGEVLQARPSDDTSSKESSRLEAYLHKTVFKTASLMALSCQSAALLGDYEPQLVNAAFAYGQHVGIAFQLVDDALDFGTTNEMGKPILSDIHAGIMTAPILLSVRHDPTKLTPRLQRRFRGDGDITDQVIDIIREQGVPKTLALAQWHAEKAMHALLDVGVSASPARDALITLASQVVTRRK